MLDIFYRLPLVVIMYPSCPAPSLFGTMPPLQRIWRDRSVSFVKLSEWLAAICHHCRACSTPQPWSVRERLWLTPPTLNQNCSKNSHLTRGYRTKMSCHKNSFIHTAVCHVNKVQVLPLTETLAPLPLQSHINAVPVQTHSSSDIILDYLVHAAHFIHIF